MRSLMPVLVLWMVLAGGAAQANEPVDLELVFLADASGSIDDDEIMFQRQGYAQAIVHPKVLDAIRSGYHQKIAVTYVEWGAAFSQEVVVPWTVITGPDSAAAFAKALGEKPRLAVGRNAIGSALTMAIQLIEDNAITGKRKVIDLSADSANSWDGVPLPMARYTALSKGIVINGLAVLCRHCSGPPVGYDLAEAFKETIIGGPGSFVISADNPAQFAEAVLKKMLLEIAAVDPGGADPDRVAFTLLGSDAAQEQEP